MKQLYELTFYTSPNGDDREGFHIGLFKTYEEAAAVEVRYRREVRGFKDYACEAEIKEIPVIGSCEKIQTVYRFAGWNEDEAYNEIDVIESNCYVSQKQAQEDCGKARQQMLRQEWALNSYTVGECDWQEGFIRLDYER